MRQRVEVLYCGLRLVGEALHLNVGDREKSDFIPDVKHDVDLQERYGLMSWTTQVKFKASC